MLKQSVALIAVSLTVSVNALASASPAMATGDSSWTMPDLRGLTLQKADEAVLAATGDPDTVVISKSLKVNQEQRNRTNWVVCWTNPEPDTAVSKTPEKVFLFVKRPNEKSCS